MGKSLNSVQLIGNVGQDPEIRVLPSGNTVANFSIATSETWKDKNTGQKQELTEWSKCNAFGPLAEIIQKYVRKGSKIYVQGKLKTRKWQDQSGADRYSTEIIVKDMVLLDGKPQGQQQGGYQQPPQGYQQPPQGYQQPPPQGYQAPPQGYPQGQPPQSYQQPPVQQPPPQGYQNPPPQQGQNPPPQPPPQQGGYQPPPGGFDDFDDEIPFN